MASNERKTENLTEQELRKVGFKDEDWQFQGSEEDEIQRCLPSKKAGRDGKGKPEFIVRLNGDAADILVIECKLDSKCHASSATLGESSKLKAADFAEDGVIHYMKGLRKEYNVIGLAISGNKYPLQISTFLALRNGAIQRKENKTILRREDYLQLLRNVSDYGQKSEEEIMIFARSLHNYFRDKMELSDQHKPLIVSGILLGLKQTAFEQGYRAYNDKDKLAKALYTAIDETLEDARIDSKKRRAMMSNYEFIKNHQAVKDYLKESIARIYRNLFFALQELTHLDFLGSFYGEFLRYSGGDQKNLGIVLTPRHITELFCEIAELDPEKSVVMDICAGSGGFLISGMVHMIKQASANSDTITRIKEKGLIGVELAPHMFTLACANMILRGDGKANMFLDDCLHPKQTNDPKEISFESKIAELKPNVAFLNPPYSKKDKSKDELRFVKQSLDLLDKSGGIGVAIVPVGCLIDDSKTNVQIKKELLDKHSLKAVMSMPPTLFPKVGTVTAIIVFEAHKPHWRKVEEINLMQQTSNGMPTDIPLLDANGHAVKDVKERVARKKTWFGYWREDGFYMKKNSRVERQVGSWLTTKKYWLDTYLGEEEIPGYSCKKAVSYADEWVAEAYLETDYSALTMDVYTKEVKKFLLYNLMIDVYSGTNEIEDEIG